MSQHPETRESLILRLPSRTDVQAWREFIEIYEPLLFRFARRRGLQEADAREIAQNVFLAVARSVENWKPDPERGRFRAWLFRIARNQLINYVAKHSRHQGSGSSSHFQLLQQQPAPQAEIDDITRDYRKEMFRLAASQVREAFQPATWEAFWRTAVLGEPTLRVAGELGVSPAAIYIARSRVIARIRQTIETWERDDVL